MCGRDTALLAATQYGTSSDVLAVLLEAGADRSATDSIHKYASLRPLPPRRRGTLRPLLVFFSGGRLTAEKLARRRNRHHYFDAVQKVLGLHGEAPCQPVLRHCAQVRNGDVILALTQEEEVILSRFRHPLVCCRAHRISPQPCSASAVAALLRPNRIEYDRVPSEHR